MEADVGEYSTTITARLRNNLIDDESAKLLNPRTYESTSIPASLVEAAEVRSPPLRQPVLSGVKQ